MSCVQHKTYKVKNITSHFLGLSHEESGTSAKLQKRDLPKQKCHFDQGKQKLPKRFLLPCISKSSVIFGKPIAPFPIRQAHSTMDFKDLKYSDMFKEINSNGQGPGIYEMFGTPIYSQARELNGHESKCCRNVHSAPAGRLYAMKHKANRLSEKSSSKITNAQKKNYPKTQNKSSSTKRRQTDFMSKVTPELEDSSPEQDEGMIVFNAGGQVKTSKRAAAPFHDDDAQKRLASIEVLQSAKKNKAIPNSNLSTIEEVPLEQVSDMNDGSRNKVVATSVQELLWPVVKDHAEYAPFLSSSRDTHEKKNQGRYKSITRRNTESIVCLLDLEPEQVLYSEGDQASLSALSFPERAPSSLSQRNLQCGKIDLANSSTKWNYHPIGPVSQVYQNVPTCTSSEEITEDSFCCLATELLSFDSADANCFRTVPKNAGGETQNGGGTSNKEANAGKDQNKVSTDASFYLVSCILDHTDATIEESGGVDYSMFDELGTENLSLSHFSSITS